MSADVAVGFLLENLTQLLRYYGGLIAGVKGDAEALQRDLKLLETFVQDSAKKRRSHPALQVIVNQIRDLVYEAEDSIDTYVTVEAVQKARNFISKTFHIVDQPKKLKDVASKIREIRNRVNYIYQTREFGLQRLLLEDAGILVNKVQNLDDKELDEVVGFDEEAETVINRLRTESTDLEVLTIIGMPGLGKTTLARKIFMDEEIEYDYFIRAWAYVSQDYVKREVLLSILHQVTTITPEIRDMTNNELVDKLRQELKDVKYFIVMDDVWDSNAWMDLKGAFPNNSKSSRILITSRNRPVASAAHPRSDPHKLKFLSIDESLELLQIKVFGKKGEFPTELVATGRTIAAKCDGVPLTIIVIAGILIDKGTDVNEWIEVANSKLEEEDKCNEAVRMSYDQLPYHLKACFLYFGVFPEDFEVPVWKLIRLWIGEGFIKKKPNEELSYEAIAERYLLELVDRNLVMVGKWKWNGRIKTCRVHDLMYFFCKKEAPEENFFQEIKGQFRTTDFSNLRRLCIHSNVRNYISPVPFGPRVRSMLCFSRETTALPREEVSVIFAVYKLLRVLDIKPIRFPIFPLDVAQLIHLRYLALSGDFKNLPKAISGLWNLQTLIIDTSNRTLEIKGGDLWKMLQLRHVHCNASSILPKPPPKVANAENLQTMTTISPESCAEEILAKVSNLKKLGIRGKLATLFAESCGLSLFDNVGKLQHLESLKLFNDESLGCHLTEGNLQRLPQSYRFPPKLKKLTISDTSLKWSDMSILALLDNLEVLKLKDYAFKGETWHVQREGGFNQLKVLHLERTDLVTWHASARHFPLLQCVFLRNLSTLKVIPHELAEISSLCMMDLYCVSVEAAQCAKVIADCKEKKKKKAGQKGNEFKLSIYPPDHWPKK